MLKGRLMTCPGDVTITVHEPISTEGITRSAAREFVERVREVIRRDVDEPPPSLPTAAPDGARPSSAPAPANRDVAI
jgi:hypothetical protein